MQGPIWKPILGPRLCLQTGAHLTTLQNGGLRALPSWRPLPASGSSVTLLALLFGWVELCFQLHGLPSRRCSPPLSSHLSESEQRRLDAAILFLALPRSRRLPALRAKRRIRMPWGAVMRIMPRKRLLLNGFAGSPL